MTVPLKLNETKRRTVYVSLKRTETDTVYIQHCSPITISVASSVLSTIYIILCKRVSKPIPSGPYLVHTYGWPVVYCFVFSFYLRYPTMGIIQQRATTPNCDWYIIDDFIILYDILFHYLILFHKNVIWRVLMVIQSTINIKTKWTQRRVVAF